MQAVRDALTKKILYLFEDNVRVIITDAGMMGGRTIAADIRPNTHEIVNAPAPPMPFVGGMLTYDGKWDYANVADKMQAIIDQITAATQQRLDDFAKTRNYDGILSACSYATSTNAKFAVEGQYCVTARDNTWDTLYQIMADVQANIRPMPSGYDDIKGDLPELEWPEA